MGVNDNTGTTGTQAAAAATAQDEADRAKADAKAKADAAKKAAEDAKAAEKAKVATTAEAAPSKRIRIREDSLVDVVVDESGFELKRGETVDAGVDLADRLLARPGQEVELLEIHEHGTPA